MASVERKSGCGVCDYYRFARGPTSTPSSAYILRTFQSSAPVSQACLRYGKLRSSISSLGRGARTTTCSRSRRRHYALVTLICALAVGVCCCLCPVCIIRTSADGPRRATNSPTALSMREPRTVASDLKLLAIEYRLPLQLCVRRRPVLARHPLTMAHREGIGKGLRTESPGRCAALHPWTASGVLLASRSVPSAESSGLPSRPLRFISKFAPASEF